MADRSTERRIKALEVALLDYVGRYGLSDLARRAFVDPEKGNVGEDSALHADPAKEDTQVRADSDP